MSIEPPPPITETRPVARVLTENVGATRQQARDLQQAVDDLHLETHDIEWRQLTAARAKEKAREQLEELADLGFAWRDIARMVGVSVPAVQKWRRGEHPTGENRHKLAGLMAGCDLIIDHYLIEEIASWFEIPLSREAPVTSIDLWAGNRPDLVFDYASGQVDPEDILNRWDANWRERYQSDYEVYEADDGFLAIRPKES